MAEKPKFVAARTFRWKFYLADSGFTLTAAMNLQTRKCYGVASNEKQWFPVTGTLEVVK